MSALVSFLFVSCLSKQTVPADPSKFGAQFIDSTRSIEIRRHWRANDDERF